MVWFAFRHANARSARGLLQVPQRLASRNNKSSEFTFGVEIPLEQDAVVFEPQTLRAFIRPKSEQSQDYRDEHVPSVALMCGQNNLLCARGGNSSRHNTLRPRAFKTRHRKRHKLRTNRCSKTIVGPKFKPGLSAIRKSISRVRFARLSKVLLWFFC